MKLPNLAPIGVSLRGIFWLYASKECSCVILTDLLKFVVLFNVKIKQTFIVKETFVQNQKKKLKELFSESHEAIGNSFSKSFEPSQGIQVR